MASRKNMSDYKAADRKLYPSPKRVQELIPVYKIGQDGVFLLEDLPDGVFRDCASLRRVVFSHREASVQRRPSEQ